MYVKSIKIFFIRFILAYLSVTQTTKIRTHFFTPDKILNLYLSQYVKVLIKKRGMYKFSGIFYIILNLFL